MSNEVRDRVKTITRTYQFKFNQELTDTLSNHLSFPIGSIFHINNQLLCAQRGLANKLVSIDTQFSCASEHTLSFLKPCQILSLVAYNGEFILLAPEQGIRIRCTQNFQYIDILESIFPELQNKYITAAVSDNNGNIYFAERPTGTLYVYDANKNLSIHTTDQNFVYFMYNFKNAIYTLDLIPLNRYISSNNIYVFQNDNVRKSKMFGSNLAYSSEQDCFFTTNNTIKRSVTKYSSSGELIFEKFYPDDQLDIFPYLCFLVDNHLIVIDASSWKPFVYDI